MTKLSTKIVSSIRFEGNPTENGSLKKECRLGDGMQSKVEIVRIVYLIFLIEFGHNDMFSVLFLFQLHSKIHELVIAPP